MEPLRDLRVGLATPLPTYFVQDAVNCFFNNVNFSIEAFNR